MNEQEAIELERENLIAWIEEWPVKVCELLYKLEHYEEEKRGGTVTSFLDDLRNRELI